MNDPIEVELKFLVFPGAREALLAELGRGSVAVERTTLAAMYLDTDDRRLARAGLSWRLRREGRRWIQTLKAGGANPLERFEHEVIRPEASHDAAAHAGTPVGDRLIALLRQAQDQGVGLDVHYRTEVRRITRTLRTRGAVVEIAFDEGRLVSNESIQRIHEIEFERVSGSTTAMLALVERWRKRFGLIYDPRSKAERGDRLAQGSPYPPLRKSARPVYAEDATATDALGAVVDECLAQMSRNAIGLVEGDPALRVEHVHQLRVGIRRLRSALRSYQDWTPAPPAGLVDGLRTLFATLGLSRDSDVLDSGVVVELAKVGAPPLALPAGSTGPDPADAVRAGATQQMMLAWITWRSTLTEQASVLDSDAAVPSPDDAGPTANPAEEGTLPAAARDAAQASDDAQTFHRQVERRLRRWHLRIVADWHAFDDLDEPALHALRKRIKRQRYAVEFFAPLLRRRKLERYLRALAAIQDRMGELNDLFVARARYQACVDTEPTAWFALGWLTARIAEVRTLAKPALRQLAKSTPPAS